MPEEVQTTAAPPSAEPAESSPAIEIPTDPEAYAEWRVSQGRSSDDAKGEGKQPKQEDSAPSSSESTASEADKSQEKQQQKHRSNEGERIKELLGELKTHGLKPSDLKLSREELIRRLSPTEPQPKAAPETTEQPAAAPAAEPQEPVEPQFKDYNGDWEGFDAALKKYHRDYAKFVAQQAVQADRYQRAVEANQEKWRQKLTEAKARYGAEADQAIVQTALKISKDEKVHPAVKALLDDSPVLADLLYVMGSAPDDFDAFVTEARERPGIAIRRAVLLEKLVQDELESKPSASTTNGQTRDDTGKFVSAAAKPPAKKSTAAPAPPAEVSGHGPPPGDEAQRAAQTGDFRAFRAIENRKTLSRLRGQ